MKTQLVLAFFGILFGVLIGVACIELGFQLFFEEKLARHDPNTQFDAELGWRPVRLRKISHEWGTISANEHGFRSPPLDRSRKQVVLLGDSVGWGFGVSDEHSLSYLLEPRLKPLGLQLTNLSVSGYGIDQYFLRLKENEKLLGDRLDFLLVILCSQNDYKNTTRNFTDGRRKMLFRFEGGALSLTNVPIARFSLRNLLSDSFLFARLSDSINIIEAWSHEIAGDIVLPEPEAKQVTMALIQEIVAAGKRYNSPTHFILSPDLKDFPTRGPRYENLLSILKESQVSHTDYHTTLRETGADLKDLYYDRWHYTLTGNQILADLIMKIISTQT